jgi:tetratricopeptide (TPR) repeat protein
MVEPDYKPRATAASHRRIRRLLRSTGRAILSLVKVRTAVAIAVLALVAACSSQAVKSQRRILAKALPATLEAPTRYEGEVRVARARVWADADYRSQNLRWKRTFGDELDHANELLGPMLGIRVEAEYFEWDRHAPGASLTEAVEELRSLDDGDDVTWVIGLTSALPLVTANTDELGMAELLGPHLVLRGYADVEERKRFAKAFPDLEPAEREEVHDARRRHKQAVLLIHELAHTLGAIHETDPAWIMNGGYRPEQASISDRNRELMLIALADRLRPESARDPLATAELILTAVESADWGGWIADEKQALIDQLRAEIHARQSGATASPVPAAAAAQYRRAEQLAAAGKIEDALAELEPILAAYPGNAAIRLLSCRIHLRGAGGKDEQALAVCARAAELAPGDPAPYTSVAMALLGAGDQAGARAQLAEAEVRIANLSDGVPEAWIEIATMYQAMGALTWAEDAIGKSGKADHEIAGWASRTRARYGVPRDGKRFKLAPASEAEAVLAVRSLLDLVYAGKLADAERAAKAAEKRWPGLPGVLAARCDLAMRQKKLPAARKLCRRAIEGYDGAAWAHYLLGILILQGKDTAAGIASLQAAVAADPELTQAWRAMAKAYGRAKDQAGLDELRASYQARFGQPLPE